MATIVQRHTIDSIRSKLLRPSLTSQYICNFQPPGTEFISNRMTLWRTTLGANDTYDYVSLACAEASLPGSSLATIDIDNDYHGVSEKHAYRRIYDDRIDFTFYVTINDQKQYYVIKFFEAWIGYIVNEQYTAKTPVSQKNYNYRVNYPRNYYADSLSVTKFEKDYDLSSLSEVGTGNALTYNFENAYPININSMPVSYDQSDLLKCTVSFSYSRYWISAPTESLVTQAQTGFEQNLSVRTGGGTLTGPGTLRELNLINQNLG
jgi:hypothetical protein